MNEFHLVSIFVAGTLAFVTLLGIIFYMLIMQNKRRYKYKNEHNRREYEYKNELLTTQIELQEHLLNEVSREIHDNVGQILSLVKVNLFSVGNQVTDPKTIHLIKTSSELLDKAINDLRSISHSNNADLLNRIGLKEALRKELDYINGFKRQTCAMHINGEHYSMTPEQELMTYRTAQEAIHNCIKHSKADTIKVILDYEPLHFTLTISDNGVGFNLSDISITAGIGISHMKHRAKVLGAEFDISSKPQQGTTITLKVPQQYA